jgi:hypothetical protein
MKKVVSEDKLFFILVKAQEGINRKSKKAAETSKLNI